MKKTITLLLIVWTGQLIYAQSYDTLFYDKDDNLADSKNYYSKTTLQKVGDKSFKSLSYYRNGIIKAECDYYTDKLSKVTTKNHRALNKKGKVLPHGYFKFYNEDGRLKSIAEFIMGKTKCSKDILEDGREIFTIPEVSAQFPGGLDKFGIFLKQKLTHLEKGKQGQITGTTYAKFIISESGELTETEIIRGLNDEIDAKILKVLSQSPNWTPAKCNGVIVPQKIIVPIRYN